MRVKEAPASALRAMFGGIGSLLGVTDKIRAKPAATEAAVGTETAAPETAAPETAAPEAAAPETAAPETAAPEAAAPEAAAPETAAPETAAPETAAPETAAAEATAGLPLANYDNASIASLRARLRNLSADQLATLIEYEKAHADRADVLSMFERRIGKLAEA
jgi:outer membrane biosynthesis protein TonB